MDGWASLLLHLIPSGVVTCVKNHLRVCMAREALEVPMCPQGRMGEPGERPRGKLRQGCMEGAAESPSHAGAQDRGGGIESVPVGMDREF